MWVLEADKLDEILKMKGLTQADFCGRLGMRPQNFFNMRRYLSTKNILKICNTFDIDPAYFFARCVSSKPQQRV